MHVISTWSTQQSSSTKFVWNGRKRHLVTDTLDNHLTFTVTAANAADAAGGQATLTWPNCYLASLQRFNACLQECAEARE